MNVLLFGASGTIGSGVLLACQDHPAVTTVRVVGRASLGISHPKVTEILHKDFLDFHPIAAQLAGVDAVFWCLGTASSGMTEADYRRITLDYTVAALEVLLRASPQAVFCFVSGRGTVAPGQKGAMWARVKGEAEARVLAAGFRHAACLRPGLIYREGGAAPRGLGYRLAYGILDPLRPLMQWMAPGAVTTNRVIGRAMIAIAQAGEGAPILECADINTLGASGAGVT